MKFFKSLAIALTILNASTIVSMQQQQTLRQQVETITSLMLSRQTNHIHAQISGSPHIVWFALTNQYSLVHLQKAHVVLHDTVHNVYYHCTNAKVPMGLGLEVPVLTVMEPQADIQQTMYNPSIHTEVIACRIQPGSH